MIFENKDKVKSRSECTLQLLSDLQHLFEASNISYIAGGIPARAAIEKKKRVFPCMDVYIEQRDYQNLHKRLLMQNKPDRAVEEVSYDGSVFLKYVDRTTTFIDSSNVSFGLCQGIHIKIFPVIKNKTLFITKSFKAPDANMKKKDFPIEYLHNTQTVKYENCRLSLPRDTDGWFKWLFFDESGNGTFPAYPNATCIVSTTIGYESILKAIPDWDQYVKETEKQLAVIRDTSRRIDERDRVINRVYENLWDLYRNAEQV